MNNSSHKFKNKSQLMEQKILEEKIKDYATGATKLRRYRLGSFLGKGGFAKCYQATQLDSNKQVALKVIGKSNLVKSRNKQKLLSEIKIHKAMAHPFIVKFLSVFEDDTNVYIVLELCTGRSMSEMVKKRKYLTCEEVRYYLLQLISALQYLHANQVIHRDLKMANIFLSQKLEVKLGDFGLSAKLQFCEEKKRTMAGTPNYIAPQIIDGSSGHSYEVDLWSTGIICYALLFGRPPFETSELKMTYSRIKSCQYSFPVHVQVPSCAKDFIKKTLVVDPKKRMSIAEMYEHPFLKGERPISMPITAIDEVPVFNKDNIISSSEVKSVIPAVPIVPLAKITAVEATSKNTQVSRNQDLVSKAISGRQTERGQRNNILLQSKNINENKQSNQPQIDKQMLSKHIPTSIKPALNSLPNLGVHAIAYVDYSTKYGFGYYLNNGCMGVYFNDCSLLTADQQKTNYYYLENPAHNDQYQSYTQAQIPVEHNFTKKKMLFNKFEGHLLEQLRAKGQKRVEKQEEISPLIFVKQWLKTKHAIMFRLNNKIFQVDFFDKSQIILKTDTKQIKFKSKKGQQQYLLLNEALNEKQKDSQLGRRIKYTKQILNSLKKQHNENQEKDKNQKRTPKDNKVGLTAQ